MPHATLFAACTLAFFEPFVAVAPAQESSTAEGNPAAPRASGESSSRRALPPPIPAPPFPSGEWQGYPLVGIPPDTTLWPFMEEIKDTSFARTMIDNRINVYGW